MVSRSKCIPIFLYLTVWTIAVAVFWFGGNRDALAYSIFVFFVLLPLSSLAASIFVALDRRWDSCIRFLPFLFGFFYMLADYATFKLANTLAFQKINFPDFSLMLTGIACSGFGLLLGSAINYLKTHRSK